MRRAVAWLTTTPGYVLTDGFRVPGLARPNLAVPKGDQTAGCIAAASVLAKVTRDRIMVELDREWPCYGFAEHKGYCTPGHDRTLAEHGPSPVHRYSFVNVSRAGAVRSVSSLVHNSQVRGTKLAQASAVDDAEVAATMVGQGVES
jgi:ribonuclease HII